jgi:hypothetical protein
MTNRTDSTNPREIIDGMQDGIFSVRDFARALTMMIADLPPAPEIQAL